MRLRLSTSLSYIRRANLRCSISKVTKLRIPSLPSATITSSLKALAQSFPGGAPLRCRNVPITTSLLLSSALAGYTPLNTVPSPLLYPHSTPFLSPLLVLHSTQHYPVSTHTSTLDSITFSLPYGSTRSPTMDEPTHVLYPAMYNVVTEQNGLLRHPTQSMMLNK